MSTNEKPPKDINPEEQVPLAHPVGDNVQGATKYRELQTAGLYAVMFGFGLINALYGSCLVNLEGLYGVDTATLSVSLACLSGGLMAGDLLCGIIFDRLNSSMVMCLSCLVLGTTTFIAPWMPSVTGFSAMMCLQGFSVGFIDTSLGPYMLSLWSKHHAKHSIFQASYPIWSVGSFLSPLFVKPFLVDSYSEEVVHSNGSELLTPSTRTHSNGVISPVIGEHSNSTDVFSQSIGEDLDSSSMLNESTIKPSFDQVTIQAFTEYFMERGDVGAEDIMNQTDIEDVINVKSSISHASVRYAYASVSSFTILTSIFFLVIFFVVGLPILKKTKKPTEKSKKKCKLDTTCKQNRVFQCGFLGLLFLFYYVYQHVEAVIGAYLAIFVVKSMGHTVKFGATMVSILYGSQAVGRVLGVPIAYFVSPRIVLWINLSFLCIAHVLMILVPVYGHVILITSVLMSGLFQSTIFGTVMLYVSEYMPLTGFASAVIQIGSSTGKLVGFTFAAYMFDHFGPLWLLYILLGSSVVLVVMFGCMNIYVHCMENPIPLVVTLDVDNEATEKEKLDTGTD